MCGNVSSTSPSENCRPIPPSPEAPWHDEQLPYTSAPTARGPATASGASVRARTYMKPQIGSRLSAPIAQNGIFGRRFAAAT